MLRPSIAFGSRRLYVGLAVLALNVNWARAQAHAGRAPAQIVEPSVQIETGGAALIHRTPVIYPETLMERGVQGRVVVEVTLDDAGNVIDARVLSGPLELRKPALASVLDWHFRNEGTPGTRQVSVAFRLLPVEDNPAASGVAATPRIPASAAEEPWPENTVGRITVLGLSDRLRDELVSRLPVRVGDALSDASMRRLGMELRKFDEHLFVNVLPLENGRVALEIETPDRFSLEIELEGADDADLFHRCTRRTEGAGFIVVVAAKDLNHPLIRRADAADLRA